MGLRCRLRVLALTSMPKKRRRNSLASEKVFLLRKKMKIASADARVPAWSDVPFSSCDSQE